MVFIIIVVFFGVSIIIVSNSILFQKAKIITLKTKRKAIALQKQNNQVSKRLTQNSFPDLLFGFLWASLKVPNGLGVLVKQHLTQQHATRISGIQPASLVSEVQSASQQSSRGSQRFLPALAPTKQSGYIQQVGDILSAFY